MPKIGLVIELDAEGVAGVVVRYDERHPDQKLRILTRALPGLALLDEALAGIAAGDDQRGLAE